MGNRRVFTTLMGVCEGISGGTGMENWDGEAGGAMLDLCAGPLRYF